MAANQPTTSVPQRIPQNLNPQQYALYQQQQQADLEQKRLHDMLEALSYITNIRDDINLILNNVAKVNSANNYTSLLAGKTLSGKTTESTNAANDAVLKKSPITTISQIPSVIGTPASVSNIQSQPQAIPAAEVEPSQTNETIEDFANLDLEQQQFFAKTDTKI